MMMATSIADISKEKIKVEMDFSEELRGLSPSKKEELKDLIQAIVEDNLFRDVSRGISPVDGSRFPKLSKMYKEYKSSVAGNTDANLELTGDMFSSLTTKFSRNKLVLEIKKSNQIPKAYNHLVGDTLPQRQFLPIEDGELFRRGIMSQIKEAVNEVSDGQS